MKNISIIIFLMIGLSLLLLTGCQQVGITPEINSENLEYQGDTNDTETVDNGGGIVDTEGAGTVEADTTKPVITGSRDPLPNSLGWNNTDVTVSFSCEDVGPIQSGIETNTVAGMTVTTEGKYQSVTNTGTCIDAAGNVADPVTVSGINIDKTPPVVIITLPKNGKYALKESVTATWSATDALSGVEDSKAPKTIKINTKSKGKKKITLPAGLVKDEAGNSSEEVTISYSVIEDTETPVIEDTETPVIEDTEDPEMIYPQKWATGTGTASNPWANDCIKKAYDACPTGGTIFLRAGYYQLAGRLTIQKSINIIGEGMGKTIIKTSTDHGFYIWHTDHVTFRGITVDGNNAQDEHKDGLWFDGSHYATVEDVEVKNVKSFGICGDWNYSYFHNIHSHDNKENGMHSCPYSPGLNMHNTFRDIYCWNNGDGNSQAGFDMVGYESTNDTTVENNVYDNIQCWDNDGNGISLQYLNGCTLSNSSVSGNANKGAYISLGKNMNISNCDAVDNGKEGIGLYDLDDVNLTNVISRNNNTLKATGWYANGMVIAGCSKVTFDTCQSYDDKETPLQEYGMYVGSGNSDISILYCKLSPNKNGEIYNLSGAVVTVITDKMLAKF